MKKILTALIVGLFVIGFSSLAFGDSIWNLDFETSGGYTTSVAEFSDGSYDYFIRSDGSNIGTYVEYSNIQGSYFFGAQDTDGDGGPDYLTLSIDDISISNYTTLVFKVYLAEDDAYDGAEDWDATTYLHISYDIDNSGSFTNLIWVEAEDGTNTVPKIDTDFDGIGDGTEITPTFTEFSANIAGTGSVIDILVEFNDLGAGDEDIAIDNLLINGTPTGGVSDPTSFTATTSSVSQIDLSWAQNGNNDDVMIAWNFSDTFGTPIDGTSYSANDPITGGGTVLYNGSNTSYNHTSLNSNTQYFYKAWSVDGSVNYSSGVTANATTYKDEPTNHVTGFTATENGWNKIDLSWTENDGSVVPDGYLIKASTSDNVSNPVDGTPVADNTTIGNDSGAINLSHGTTSYQWTGLNEESTYYFKIYPYTNSGSAIDYKTVGTVPSANATTGEKPAVPYVFFSEYIEGSSNNKAIEIYNGSLSTIDLSGYAVKLASNGGGWGTTENLSGNLASGDVYVIYNSGACSDITNVGDLASTVTYFNGDDALGLFYSDMLIDVIGEQGVDPGDYWPVAGVSDGTKEHTLVRKSTVTTGNTDWSASAGTTTENSEWIVYAQDTFSYLGSHDGQTLPIILSTFTAQYLNSKPTLYWQTQSEEDNMGWFIYRNTVKDFTSAEKITGMIEGHGTTTQPQSYIYEDAEELQIEQTYYYWLESVDYSGTIHHYDRVAQVTIPHPNDPGQNVTPPVAYDITADPNPFSHTTEITFAIDQISRVDVSIYNIKGELVKSFNTVITNADEEVSFQWNGKDNAGKTLSNGVYLYSVKVNGNDYATKQLILMK